MALAVSSQSNSWFYQWQPSDGLLERSARPGFHHEHHIQHTQPHGFHFFDAEVDDARPAGKSQNFASFLPWFMSFSLMNNGYGALDNEIPFQMEKSGPLDILYQWRELDFEFSSDVERDIALSSGDFIPENNLPLGIDVWKDRVFVTMPRWKKGVPVTLGWVPRIPKERSPKVKPYPNWDWHSVSETCNTLTSVFRIFADACGRLWVLDSGQIEVTVSPRQICPPSISIFDLDTDELILRYELPEKYVKQDSLYTNIVVDIREGKCREARAYVTDVWRYGILVFDLRTRASWRVSHGLFFPDPVFTKYTLGDLQFRWNDGIFGMALGPHNPKYNDRLLYYHPMSSSNEFYVKVSLLLNETAFDETVDAAKLLGQSRGADGHSSASGMDRNGVMFFNMVTRNSVNCWDSNKPYLRRNIAVVDQSNVTLVFPNDLKIDQEPHQSVWILSNKLPFYLYRGLDRKQVNFRLLRGFTDEVVRDTVCDPNIHAATTIDTFQSECP